MTRRFDNRVCRFVEFMIGQLAEKTDPLDEDGDEAPAAGEPKYEQQTFGPDGFMAVPDGMDLPFA